MEKDDMFLLLEYLNNQENLNEKMNKLLNKVELICKQIKLQENFQNEIQEIGRQIEELKK